MSKHNIQNRKIFRNSLHQFAEHDAQHSDTAADNHDSFGNDSVLQFFGRDFPRFGDRFQFLPLLCGEFLRRAAIVVKPPEKEDAHQNCDLGQNVHGIVCLFILECGYSPQNAGKQFAVADAASFGPTLATTRYLGTGNQSIAELRPRRACIRNQLIPSYLQLPDSGSAVEGGGC